MDPQISPRPPGAPSLPTQQLTPTSKKRNYEGNFVDHPSSITPPDDPGSSPSSFPHSRSRSPVFSSSASPLTEIGSPSVQDSNKSAAMAPADPKKRKLTLAEKEVERALKLQEKEEKEKLKAEAKAKKDEEKRRKDEERDVARKAREEKQRQKDAIKHEKEAEKERKMAEAQKKEKAQMRIGAFFGRPAAASTPPASPDVVSDAVRSRRSSVTSLVMEPSLDESTIGKPSNTDYANWILPFFVNEHTELAPFNRFHSTATTRIDDWLSMNQQVASTNSRSLFRSHRRVRNINPIKQILEQMSSSVDGPIDLTESTDPLAKVPYKFLFFQQDIRPPYKGTYTRPVSPRSTRKLARNPCHRGLPDTNYDYDSEAEWQEPEEGDDDLMDEDEKSEDEDADEEMDDFLDDEGTVVKRQLLVSDMEPKSSGLCWAGSEISPQGGFDLSIYRMDVLHDSTTFPIDPYSTKHWSDTGKSSPNKRDKTQASASHPAMQPPRLPLAAVDGNGGNLATTSNLLGFVSTNGQLDGKTPTPKLKGSQHASYGKPAKMVPSDILPSFKDAIAGSTLTKLGLIEVLKQQFPKCPKDAIKNTLESVAVRQGGKDVEKKWILVE